MQVHSAVLFESREQIYERVFRELRPSSPAPPVTVRFCRFANANSFIRLRDGKLEVRLSDVLDSAPAPIHEALAFILLGKLYRKQVDAGHSVRYRRYLSRPDVRKRIHQTRQERGRKYLDGPAGERWNLEEMFEELNLKFFHGLMARPELGWSRQRSRTMLGHYDPSHNTIVLSRILDGPEVPRIAVEYVLYHEMLHLRFPVKHNGHRRCIHGPEFRAAEKEFPGLAEAKAALKKL